MNIPRRKRQAFENVDTIITDVYNVMINESPIIEKESTIRTITELDSVITELEPDVISHAQSLEPNWAIPIVIQAIGELYYGRYVQYSFEGNYFKRSLAYLWQNSCTPHGTYKNIAGIQEFIRRCYMIETLYSFRKMFLAIPAFYLEFRNGHVIVPPEYMQEISKFGMMASGKGTRLRISKVNSRLMNESPFHLLSALKYVLDGQDPKTISIFKDTFYEYIPGIKNEECAHFWKEVFFRFTFYLSAKAQLKENENISSVILFREFAVPTNPKYIPQEVVENSFWKTNWFKNKIPECYANALLEKPILRISPQGDFATSVAVMGDSLNWFVESQLLRYSTRSPYLNLPDKVFKDAFSEKFEDQCIELFQRYGYRAGHVLESGVWKNQDENVVLSVPDEKLYGEIDVFAYHHDYAIAFLVECKVLLDIQDSRSYQNVASKLKDDSEGFKFKLRQKADWIEKAFLSQYGHTIKVYKFLVTDIPLPILGIDDDDVVITDYYSLENLLQNVNDDLINGTLSSEDVS